MNKTLETTAKSHAESYSRAMKLNIWPIHYTKLEASRSQLLWSSCYLLDQSQSTFRITCREWLPLLTVDSLALSLIHLVKDCHNFLVCGEWSGYSNCTATCDGGSMLRWRTCGGHIEVENSTCNEFPCYRPPGSRTKVKHDFKGVFIVGIVSDVHECSCETWFILLVEITVKS